MTDVTPDLDGLEAAYMKAGSPAWRLGGAGYVVDGNDQAVADFLSKPRGERAPTLTEALDRSRLAVAAVNALPSLIALARRAVPGGGEATDARLVEAMLQMAERQAEREEPGFWQDRARAHIATMRAKSIDDPEVQKAIGEARLFLAAIRSPE